VVRGNNTGSVECWPLVLKWLDDCEAHDACQSPHPTFRPSRLVDVGACDRSKLCLVTSNIVPPGANYTTLSHCWDHISQPTRLLIHNLTSLCEDMPLAWLSQTFKDAILIT
jgi:hypothetical protein